MCKQEIVPVGQGCRKMTFDQDLTVTLKTGCCAVHFWLYLNNCLECGEKFHSKRSGAKTCSDKCRKRLSRSRHATFFQTILKYADGRAA